MQVCVCHNSIICVTLRLLNYLPANHPSSTHFRTGCGCGLSLRSRTSKLSCDVVALRAIYLLLTIFWNNALFGYLKKVDCWVIAYLIYLLLSFAVVIFLACFLTLTLIFCNVSTLLVIDNI